MGAGWQRHRVAGGGAVAQDIRSNDPGVIGAYADNTSATGATTRTDYFKFFVDEVELDLAKTFGENIRLRTDLDFGSTTLNSGSRFNNAGGSTDEAGILVEQAYATTNLAVGNGVELLVGRFNAPMGFESVDVGDNDTISRSVVYRALRPISFTGAKLYYAFSDMVDFHFYLANNSLVHDAADVIGVDTDIPALGFRLGFNWGEEGRESHLGWNGAWGQDHANVKSGWSFLGDVDWQWWATDSFALGGEAIYRQVDTVTAGGINGKYFGGLLNLHYDFSDVWDGTLRYGYAHDINGAANAGLALANTRAGTQSLTGGDQQLHEMALAGNYAITDGATLKLEGGYTYIDPTGGANNQHVFGVGGGFAYAF
ncbi:MAG: outer membrane beta-barrel protein [Deltaproteobacteria bacterium]|nr:outer membrane beta-barrel protein [Deltaproteobacteria bacterium]